MDAEHVSPVQNTGSIQMPALFKFQLKVSLERCKRPYNTVYSMEIQLVHAIP